MTGHDTVVLALKYTAGIRVGNDHCGRKIVSTNATRYRLLDEEHEFADHCGIVRQPSQCCGAEEKGHRWL